MNERKAKELMDMMRDSYDAAAEEFSASRARFWDELSFLSEHAVPEGRVLDIGCGNGRFLPLIEKQTAKYTGIDYSQGLINEAKKKYPQGQFIVGDALALPFPSESFDIAYSFAALHHIPSKKLRVQFITEARRVLRPNGKLILSTWDIWQAKYAGALLSDAIKSMLWLSQLEIGDTILTLGKNKEKRYLHAFTQKELSRLLNANGFKIVGIDLVSRPSGQKNIVAIARKK